MKVDADGVRVLQQLVDEGAPCCSAGKRFRSVALAKMLYLPGSSRWTT